MLTATTMTAPYITAYQDSKNYSLAGGLARILAERSKTNGAFSLVHLTHHYGESTPLHVHHAHDEAFFVLHGDVKGVCGETEWEASGGGFVWLPRGVPHGFQAVSELPLELLVMTVPGGLDDFLADAGNPVVEGVDPSTMPVDFERIATAASRNGIELLGPPVDFLG
ncbi:MAG: cupin domain-containing protein [Chloroflexota bacterium]|nr:cupin domain-containing protein [Chloroflexota bacterium]